MKIAKIKVSVVFLSIFHWSFSKFQGTCVQVILMCQALQNLKKHLTDICKLEWNSKFTISVLFLLILITKYISSGH